MESPEHRTVRICRSLRSRRPGSGSALAVLIPSTRIAAVAANALASLSKLAPGRIDFGVGTGFTGRGAMRLGVVRLAELEEYHMPAWSAGEGGDPGLGAAEDQGVDVVGAFVGIDRFEVHHVADHVVLVGDAVAAVHVAGGPGDV
jgi:hypothetical protein